MAGKEEVVVTKHGRPAAVINGFPAEDDWLEYRLLRNEDFLARVSRSRQQYRKGKFKTLDELPQGNCHDLWSLLRPHSHSRSIPSAIAIPFVHLQPLRLRPESTRELRHPRLD